MADVSRRRQQQQQQQHVVAVPLPAQGHLNPLMRFCKLLASQYGLLVTFVNIDAVHHRMEELAQPPDASDEGPSAHIRTAHIPIPDLQDLATDFRVSLEAFYEALNTGMAAPLELLLSTLDPPATCILSDISVTLPTQNVADKLNLPRVAFVPCSASLILLLYHVTQGEHISTKRVLEALTRRAERREVVGDGALLMGLPTIYNTELPWYKHVVDDTVYMWELSTKVCEESLHHARAMVFNSFEGLEAPALMTLSNHFGLQVYGVGPCVEPPHHKEISTSLWKEDGTCIHWLDQQPPLSVLYISFGSISLLSQAQIEELIAGLLSSEQRFLWVFRPDLAKNDEYHVSTFITRILSQSCGKGYVVDWAPQLKVLSHPSVGGFLTHCGWNSVMEAIAQGVLMLCWPYFADQFLNAKYVVEVWKVGLQFKVSSREGEDSFVEREEIETIIKALMGGEEGRSLQKNAAWLKEASYESLLPGGTSHNSMQDLLRSCNM